MAPPARRERAVMSLGTMPVVLKQLCAAYRSCFVMSDARTLCGELL